MYLLRHNIRTAARRRGTRRICVIWPNQNAFPGQQIVFQDARRDQTEATARLERYDQEIERRLRGWRWEPVVRAVMALRRDGAGCTRLARGELGDFNRFDHPGR